MVELFGKSLLVRQIEIMKSCGINDIVVVTGYKSNMINIPGIIFEKNMNYKNTNMIETLFCAKSHFEGEIIITYGDIVYEKKVLEKLIDSSNSISIIVDKNWKNYWEKRFLNPLSDAETLKIGPKGNIIDIGQKTNNIAEIEGQYMGLMKFTIKGWSDLEKIIEGLKKNELKKIQITQLLQKSISFGINVKAIPNNNEWGEVDSQKDLNLYNLKK